MNLPWHAKSLLEVFSELKSDKVGLSEKDAQERLKRDGPNKLPDAKVDGLLKIFLRQLRKSRLVLRLLKSFSENQKKRRRKHTRP